MTDKLPLLISGGPSTRPLWPLLAAKYRLVFIYPQAAQAAVNEMGIADASAIAAYLTPEANDFARNSAALLSARVVSRLPTIHASLARAYAGVHPPTMLNSQFPGWFAGFAHDRIIQASSIISALECAGRANPPFAGLVVHEDVTLEMRLAIAWARAHNIPSIHIPHAPCHLLPSTRDIHAETRADYVAASGAYESEYYQACGMDAAHVTITGNPAWDYLYEVGGIPERAEARRVMKLPAEARVVLYATTWGQTTSLRSEFNKEFHTGLLAVLEWTRTNNAIVIIKLHPNQDPNDGNEFVKVLTETKTPGIVTRDHMTYCLRASDVLVSQSPSNLCVEAAILGIPSCYIQTEGFEYKHELPYRCSPDGLSGALGAALDSVNDALWQDFITYYNAAHPVGMAAERTVEFVESVCTTMSQMTSM